MHKKDFHRNCCGAACCLAFILALSGCSASNANGVQGNQASGAPSAERAADNQQAAGTQQNITGQETGIQQNAAGQETGIQQNTAGQETGTQQNAAGQETGTQQNAAGQETGTQQNVAGQDLGTQQNAAGQEIGNGQNAAGQEIGNGQNTTGQEIGSQQHITDQDLGYHQYDEPGVHHSYDEPAAGHHSSGNEIDLEAAKRIALQNAGVESANAAFTKAELDYDDGVAEYEIEFVAGATKYEYEISAVNGTVLKSSQEAVEQISGGVSSQASISVDEAKAIALNYAKFTADQVVYTKSELDYDDGRAEYEIEFYAGGKEYSFTIDAVSGTVLEMEID